MSYFVRWAMKQLRLFSNKELVCIMHWKLVIRGSLPEMELG